VVGRPQPGRLAKARPAHLAVLAEGIRDAELVIFENSSPMAAPNSVSGSARDHMAARGPQSPLCRAISASVIRGLIVARNCSVSVIGPPALVLN